mgnify:CR=1 FL=1
MDKNKNAPLEKISSHCEHADTDHKAPASKDSFKDSLSTDCNVLFYSTSDWKPLLKDLHLRQFCVDIAPK